MDEATTLDGSILVQMTTNASTIPGYEATVTWCRNNIRGMAYSDTHKWEFMNATVDCSQWPTYVSVSVKKAGLYGYRNYIASTGCSAQSGLETGGSGSISINPYEGNENCKWVIAPNDAMQITLTITGFDTEKNADYLSVFECGDANCYNHSSRRLANLSGTYATPLSFTGNTGYMLLLFASDGFVSYKGFNATWTSFAPGPVSVPFQDEYHNMCTGSTVRGLSIVTGSEFMPLGVYVIFLRCSTMFIYIYIYTYIHAYILVLT
jgi:hypothetical protein